MKRTRRRQRAFTLIELMVTLGMGATLSAAFFGIVYSQNVTYLERLQEVDAHQNARAALNIVQRYVRQSRYGMAQDGNSIGTPAIGRCYNTSVTSQSQSNCTGVDVVNANNTADRLRAVFMVNDNDFVSSQPNGAQGSCPTGSYVDSTYIRTNVTPTTNPFTFPTVAAIAGSCTLSTDQNAGIGFTAASDVVILTGDSGFGDNCAHRYVFSALEGAGLSCSAARQGYAPNFSFGHASVADFFITLNTTNQPQLMLRLDPTQPISAAYIVAFNVENMQIWYGIDTNTTNTGPSTRNVFWCHDPRNVSDGGTCNALRSDGSAFLTNQIYNRIVAVKVTLTVRSDSPDTTWRGADSDGYRRWVYTTYVDLRNNNIQ